ncbi:MAG: hypothetical protein ACI3W5_09410 [Faecousia sp.]
MRAAICGDKVFIRADHPEFTAQQLLRHEMAHREFGHESENLNDKVDVRKVYDRLVELCGTEEAVKNIITMYSEAFDMGYDAETGTDALAMEVFTEIVCDSQADMNAFAPEDRADMEGFMQEIRRIAQEEKAQNQGRAPPEMNIKASKEKKQEVFRNGQKGKSEDRQSFLTRVHGSAQTSGKIGQIAYAYEEANSYNITAYAEGTQRELQKLGIDSFAFQKMEYNDDGYTYRIKDNSISLIDGNECIVGIQARFAGNAMEVAGHEAFHIWGEAAGREEFVSILRDQLIDYSERYILTALSVASAYQVSKHSNSDASVLYAEEILARIAGQIHSGAYENGLRTMFRNYDIVKTAWVALVNSHTKAKNVDNTNPTTNHDIRFSREFVSKQMSEQEKLLEKANKALEKSNAKLQEDNQYLKQLLKLQSQVTGGTKFTKSSVEAAARELIKNADAKGDVKELSGILNDFYEYVATGKELTWEDVMSKAQPVVDWINGNRNQHETPGLC